MGQTGSSAPPAAPGAREARLCPADHPEMALIPAGSWWIGEDRAFANPGDHEGPVRQVDRGAFLIDRTAVTNAQFAAFVRATGHVTAAERQGWSFVFAAQLHPGAGLAGDVARGGPEWWLPAEGASWRAPDGQGSDLRGRADHPVVHVSQSDALAFAAFAGKRLPDESEWEIAARGGLHRGIYPWGDELTPGGRHMCNIWQGRFPVRNSGEDGWLATAPVASFPANGFGLYDMAGNCWEWTASAWHPSEPGRVALRGGSYLCHADYCDRYRVSARTQNVPGASSSHLGFRCGADPAWRDGLA